MKEFMLVFRDTQQTEEAYYKMSAEDMQASMTEWGGWMNELAQKGHLVGGQPLFPHGKVLRGTSKKLTDGPFIEGKDIVGGYLLIKATDYSEAAELSKGCPTLKSDTGTVEVREIMPIG